jgi:hypothetical protein
MAVYKVPQDVEADDKLIGPFSFRQFIYLIIVVMAGALAWGLGTIFIGLAIIPLPVILLFGALALPLRKDQPMEIYLAAMVSFYLKPRRRMWDPEGVESRIEVTEPKVIEVRRMKDISQADAEQRFSYLASIVDTGGWAIRGTASAPNSPMNTDVYFEAQSTEDVLDTNNSVAQSFDTMMEQRTERIKEEARERMFHQEPTLQATPAPQSTVFSQPTQPIATQPDPQIEFNPYPQFQQSIIQPLNDPAHAYQPAPEPVQPQPAAVQTPTKPTTTSDKPLSPGIMNLANNSDLSIETIAHEAHRIHEKEDKKEHELTEEVVISLR